MKKLILLMILTLFAFIVNAQSKKISQFPTATNLTSSFVPIIQDSSGTYVNRKIPGDSMQLKLANNGLSLSGDTVQLGGTLTNDVFVDINQREFIAESYIIDGAGLIINPENSQLYYYSALGSGFLNSGDVVDDFVIKKGISLNSDNRIIINTNSLLRFKIDSVGNVSFPNTNSLMININTDVGSAGEYLGSDGAGGVVWGTPSDRKLKEDINPLKYGLEKISMLKPVNFKYKKSKEKTVGFIAQDVQKVLPEMVSQKEGYLSLKNTTYLEPYIVDSIQELLKRIEGLEKKLAKLEKKSNRKSKKDEQKSK